MRSATLDRKPDPKALLEQAASLSDPELDSFAQDLLRLRARRRAPHLSRREEELLNIIYEIPSKDFQKRYKEFIRKNQQDELSDAERAEFIAMSDEIGRLDVKRMKALSQLADLRQTTFDDLIKSLGLRPRPYA
jgi:hypothetical protein